MADDRDMISEATEHEQAGRARVQRVLRGIVLAAGVLVGLVLLVLVLAVLTVQTDWGRERVKNLAVERLNALFNGAELQVERLGGNVVTGLVLYNVDLVRHDGERLAHVDTLAADYRLLPLLSNRLRLTDIYLASPQVWMTQRADSTWDLLTIVATDSADVDTTSRAPLIIELDHFDVRNGRVEAAFYAPGRDSVLRAEDIGIELGEAAFGEQPRLRLDTLFARVHPPGAAPGPMDVALGGALGEGRFSLNGLRLVSPRSNVTGRGTLALPSEENDQGRDLDFTLQARPLALADLRPFVPGLDPDGTVELDMRVKGGTSQIDVVLDAALSDGAHLSLTATTTPPGTAPARYRATGQIRRFDPSFVTGDPAQAGHVNADLDVDLQGPSPESVDGRAGLVVFETRYGAYALDRTTLESTFTDGTGRLDLRTGLRGATLAVGGTLRPFDAEPRYDLDGRLAGLDIGRFAENGTQHSDIDARFSVEGRGIDPQTANATVRLDLAPSRINTYRIRDGHLTAHLEGGALDFDTRVRLPEGLVAAAGQVDTGGEVRYRIREGRIQNLDVAALAGDTTRSALNATFSARGQGTDPQAMVLEARVDLRDSFYGPYRLETAGIRTGLRGGRLTLATRADLGEGGRLELAATARPFAAVPAFDVTRAHFRAVDVGVLTQNPAQHSDLNGTLRLRGHGTDVRTMALEAHLDLDPSQLNEQAIQDARLVVELDRGRAQFDGRADLPEGRVALAGAAQPFAAVPVYAVREGTFAGLNVGALAGQPDLQTDLNGSLTLEGRGLEPETMDLHAQLLFETSVINEATLRDGRVAADVQEGQARLDAALNLDEGVVQLEAAADVRGAQPGYRARGTVQELDLARLSGVDTLDARLSLDFDVEGRGVEPASMQVEGHLLARQAAYGDVRVDTLGTRFHLADGLLRLDSLLLRSNVAEARAGGVLALFDTTGRLASDFRLEAEVVSLEPVRGLVAADVFSLREGRLEARVEGPSDRLHLTATADVNSFIYNDLRLAGLDARLDGTLGPDRRPVLGDVQADVNYLSTPSLTVDRTHLDVAYDGNEATFAVETSVDERRDARVGGRIDLRPESRRLLVEDLGLRFDEDRWTLAGPATITYGDAYRVSGFTLSSGTQQIVAEGVIDPDSTQDFHLRVEQLRLDAFADLAGFETLGGTLGTTLDLTGPAADPLLTGTLHVDLRHRNDPVGDARLDLDYAGRRLNLDALLTHREGSTLAVDGYVPLDLSLAPAAPPAPEAEGVAANAAGTPGTVALRVTSDAFGIDWLRPFLSEETVEELQGTLRTDIRIGGTLDAPELDGTFALANGRVGLAELGVTYDDIEVDGALQDNNVVLRRAELHAGDGTLVAEGRIEMPELTLGRFEIDVALDDFRAIRSEQYHATASGDLAVSGTTDAPAVSGTLQFYNTDIYLGNMGSQVQEVELTDEDVRMLEEFFGYRITRGDTAVSDVYNAMALDLDIELERDTWIRQTANPEMAIELTGRLEVNKEPDEELQLFRSIEVIPQRSYIRQFGRRFDITRGTITFNGPVAELTMDIGARYEVRSRDNPGQPEAVITLGLAGRPDDLAFTLGSDPPMDNTDIVAYLATGQPASEAFQLGGDGGGGGGLLAQGGGLAAGQLAGILEQMAGEELGLDVIEIEQDGLRGMQLVAGKYVAPKVYAGIRQPIALGSAEQTAPGARLTEVTLEYEVFEWLLLQLLSGTSSSSVRVNLMGKHAFR